MPSIKTKIPSVNQSKFVLRLPGSLREQYRDLAAVHNRSINQEMISALESYAERINTLDILIKANREMLMRATDSNHADDAKNVVKLHQVKEH